MSDRRADADDPRTRVVLDALRNLPSPTLDPALAARVLARAKVHLEPPAVAAPRRIRFVVAQAAIPALLGTVVIDHIAETATAVSAAYGKDSRDPPRRR